MTIKQLLACTALALAPVAPAMAQDAEEGTAMTAVECRAMFQEADTNGDGVLSQQEIAASDLGDAQAGATLQQFVAECQGS
jgi:hypothetical protein